MVLKFIETADYDNADIVYLMMCLHDMKPVEQWRQCLKDILEMSFSEFRENQLLNLICVQRFIADEAENVTSWRHAEKTVPDTRPCRDK